MFYIIIIKIRVINIKIIVSLIYYIKLAIIMLIIYISFSFLALTLIVALKL